MVRGEGAGSTWGGSGWYVEEKWGRNTVASRQKPGMQGENRVPTAQANKPGR